MRGLADASVDAVVTDPPYELELDRVAWDSTGIAFSVPLWREVFRVLRPGGHLLAFGGTRTYHRLASAIEGAGFEIRDTIMWLYGEGFPKSLNVSKAIDRRAGAKRRVIGTRRAADTSASHLYQKEKRKDIILDITEPSTAEAKKWEGWGTTLKPACEPIVLARRPFKGTLLDHILTHGIGALNVDACRIPYESGEEPWAIGSAAKGRFPSNVMFDAEAAELLGKQSRFFYVAKPTRAERGEGNHHMTVKPVALMRELVRLVTPPGGVVLDPFAGSGTTGVAAIEEGFEAIVIERERESFETAQRRIAEARRAA
jgi:site-specific DNA-methyltransferase (adenine-specific)